MAAKAVLTADDVRALLSKRYKGQEWAVQFEVRDATGFAKQTNGYADCIAMNVWPSNGYVIHGHEIKVSRSDWQAELRKPEKAERFREHVDYWWLVAPSGVAHESEIPPGWGYMRASPKRLQIVRDAERANKRPATVPMDRGFVASLVRRRSEGEPAFQRALAEARRAITAELREAHASENKYRDKKLKEYEDYCAQLSELTGETLTPLWGDPEKLGPRFRAAMALLNRVDGQNVAYMKRTAQGILTSIEGYEEALGLAGVEKATHETVARP